jgi:hypothetical protein
VLAAEAVGRLARVAPISVAALTAATAADRVSMRRINI